MGNSNSHSPQRDDNDDGNTDDTSTLQRTGNYLVIIESVVYILGHLWRIYERVNDPDKDLVPDLLRPRENLNFFDNDNRYTSNYEYTSTYTTTSSNAPSPSAPDLDSSEPIVPEIDAETVDEPVEDDENETPCVICATNRIKTVFLNCGHTALCVGCAQQYAQHELSRSDSFVCVICKQPAKQIKQIYSV